MKIRFLLFIVISLVIPIVGNTLIAHPDDDNDRLSIAKKGHRLLKLSPDGTKGILIDEDLDPKQRTPITILSLDGGGVRGVISATILSEIERRTGKKIHRMVDFIAGTSTGGLLALGITKPNPFTSAELCTTYERLASQIFPPHMPPLSGAWSGYKYPSGPLERALENMLGKEKTLADLIVPTVITSVNASATRELFLFKSYHAAWEERRNFHLYDVGRATSAAPTYFDQATIISIFDKNQRNAGRRNPRHRDEERHLIDGGLAANNPASLALAEAKRLFGDRPVYLISIGTGQCIGHNMSNGGTVLSKVVDIIEAVFESQSTMVDLAVQSYPYMKQYLRAQVTLSTGRPNSQIIDEKILVLDNAAPENLQQLKSRTQHWYTTNQGRLFLEQIEKLFRADPPVATESGALLPQSESPPSRLFRKGLIWGGGAGLVVGLLSADLDKLFEEGAPVLWCTIGGGMVGGFLGYLLTE